MLTFNIQHKPYGTKKDKTQPIASATQQVLQQWFWVCIFTVGQLIGLTGNGT